MNVLEKSSEIRVVFKQKRNLCGASLFTAFTQLRDLIRRFSKLSVYKLDRSYFLKNVESRNNCWDLFFKVFPLVVLCFSKIALLCLIFWAWTCNVTLPVSYLININFKWYWTLPILCGPWVYSLLFICLVLGLK